MSPVLPLCALCQHECIPLADYDVPVCIPCEDRMAAIVDRANMAQPIVIVEGAAYWPELEPETVEQPAQLSAFGRPLDSYFGPAPQEVIDELVDAICPPIIRKGGLKKPKRGAAA